MNNEVETPITQERILKLVHDERRDAPRVEALLQDNRFLRDVIREQSKVINIQTGRLRNANLSLGLAAFIFVLNALCWYIAIVRYM